jgi:hypothetical protein
VLEAAAVALLLCAGCAGKDDPKEPIVKAAKAVEDRDAEAVARWLAPSYHDAEHENPQAVVLHVRQILAGYDRLSISIRQLEVEDLGGSRRARFRAELSGTPKNVPGLEAILPRSSAWDFEVSIVSVEGKWKIASASWSAR